ncbi:hypothetical protein CEXT_615741 [Caerostris extrusa]|uniref:Uncharacterized protein n=1 Tax=Caerostris extrusa TaxID=172846 RepID=A0AAV4SKW8_CAEEX|nr:hypothetical protein CEXT_615741 [Caerostris extrusa]
MVTVLDRDDPGVRLCPKMTWSQGGEGCKVGESSVQEMNEREMEHGEGTQQRASEKKRQFIQMQGANRVTSAALRIDLGPDLTFRTMLYEAAVTALLGRQKPS